MNNSPPDPAKSPGSASGSRLEPPARFAAFTAKAEKLANSPGRVRKLIGHAAQKLSGTSGGRLNAVREQILLAIALVKAWVSGEYKLASNSTPVILIAALLYFVVPLDVIPDFLFGWGFIDDIAVIGYVFGQLTEEVEAFKAWQSARGVDNSSQDAALDAEIQQVDKQEMKNND